MSREVNIFIESTWSGPAKRDGVAMWLMEHKGEELQTKQGFIHVEDGTEAQGNLMAIINAFCVLKYVNESCSVRVFTRCEHVLHTMQNSWHIQWQKNGWCNAKGKEVKNANLWEMLIDKMQNHVYTVQSGHHEYANVMQMELKKEIERWRTKT